MKSRTFVSIITFILVVLIISSCTSPSRLLRDAALRGDSGGVKIAIEEGANVNARSTDGITPLMWASLYGHLNVVKLLIEEGADVNARDNAGWTALLYALGREHTDVAQFLIEAGAKE